MQKNNRTALLLSVIAICLSLFVLITTFRDRAAEQNTSASVSESAESPAQESAPVDANTEEMSQSAAVTTVPEEVQETSSIDLPEDGSYTSAEDVALYIHLYGRLPQNYITKEEAKQLGWDASAGNLDTVAPGMSIGGDRFGNYEGLLPEGSYQECDVDYTGGHRGAERLVFSSDGRIYYTEDHYESFTQLY